MPEPDLLRAIPCRFAAILCLAALMGGCGYDQVVQSWFDHSVVSAAPASPKIPGHIYLLRGVAGDVFSLGLDQLADKITHAGVTATVHGVSESSSLADEIIRKYGAGEDHGPIALLGHSSGGDVIIDIAQKLKEADVPVALAFGFDPTRNVGAVPSNVALFINLYQRNNPIGAGEVTPAPDFRGRLINIDLHEHTEIVHITLDKTAAIQDAVAAKVVAVAAYAARQATADKQPVSGADFVPLVLKYTVPRDAPIELWDSAVNVNVKPGETLESIGSTYGAPPWAIAQINALKPDRAIEPGRTLIIPHSIYTAAPAVSPAASVPRRSVRSAARITSTKPMSHDAAPTASGDPLPARNANSFSDRWQPDPGQ